MLCLNFDTIINRNLKKKKFLDGHGHRVKLYESKDAEEGQKRKRQKVLVIRVLKRSLERR